MSLAPVDASRFRRSLARNRSVPSSWRNLRRRVEFAVELFAVCHRDLGRQRLKGLAVRWRNVGPVPRENHGDRLAASLMKPRNVPRGIGYDIVEPLISHPFEPLPISLFLVSLGVAHH